MRTVMIYDQVQSGFGTKDDTMVPLTGKKEPISPAVMMGPSLNKVDGYMTACLCCGSGTLLADPEEVSRKFCAMVNRLQSDVVTCDSTFNFAGYASMCAKVAYDISATTEAEVFAVMSIENKDTIAAYKDKVAIVETPKKDRMGLNDALKSTCTPAKAPADGNGTAELEHEFCFK